MIHQAMGGAQGQAEDIKAKLWEELWKTRNGRWLKHVQASWESR